MSFFIGKLNISTPESLQNPFVVVDDGDVPNGIHLIDSVAQFLGFGDSAQSPGSGRYSEKFLQLFSGKSGRTTLAKIIFNITFLRPSESGIPSEDYSGWGDAWHIHCTHQCGGRDCSRTKMQAKIKFELRSDEHAGIWQQWGRRVLPGKLSKFFGSEVTIPI